MKTLGSTPRAARAASPPLPRPGPPAALGVIPPDSAGAPAITVSVVLDGLRTVSELNRHEHWRGRQQRARRQRGGTRLRVALALPRRPGEVASAEARLVRFGPGRLDDDNLQGALKAVRDGVADAVDIDDGDPRWTWTYHQERAAAWGVRVELKITETGGAWA